MKTTRETTAVRECTRCGNSFMTIGQVSIELAQSRPVTKNADGEPMTGTCPRHKGNQ